MNSEFSANNLLALESELLAIEKKIKEYVGIVPAIWYDEVDRIEFKIQKAK
jgi:hypothetical protein